MSFVNKLLSVFIAILLLLLSVAPIQSSAEISNKCGENCKYELSSDGILLISGTGTITKKFNEDKEINGKIKKIEIGDGIVKIGEGCFKDLIYNKYMELTLPDTLVEVGNEAFSNCFIKDFKCPRNLKKIGDEAFKYCGCLEDITLPESLEKLGTYAFSESNLKRICLSAKLKSLPFGVFSNCKNLKTVEWSKDLTEIGSYAFEGCNFTDFEIPDCIQKVEDYAFYQCEKLKTISVGKSVKTITKKFVSRCYGLKKVVNHSKISIPVDTLKGKRTWYVGKKKVTKISAKKTANSVYKKYKIKYILDGGKVVGKKPKKYVYRAKTYLPKKVKKKGYAFFGWYISAKNDWEMFPEYIPEKLYGKLTAKAILKKYSVTSSDGRIKVSVKDRTYGKKGYKKDVDAYLFRYSENKDMSDSAIVVYTAPYGSGLSKKLKKGKTYYVQVARYLEMYMEDSEDYEDPIGGWHGKKKITIK